MLTISDTEWQDIGGDALLAEAIRGCIHPGIGLAGATKMLISSGPGSSRSWTSSSPR
jgi:hypothetical protein